MKVNRHCLTKGLMECGVTPNKMAEEDYIHARLYAFVEKYGVSALRALALSKLYRTKLA
jgi:hypothetical protein